MEFKDDAIETIDIVEPRASTPMRRNSVVVHVKVTHKEAVEHFHIDDAKSKPPEAPPFREKNIFLLLTVAQAGFGFYFFYDGIGALAPYLKAEFGITSTDIGLLYSAYSIPVACLATFGGMIYSRVGSKRLLAMCTLINSIGTLIFAAAPNFKVLYLGQWVYGIGSSTLYLTIVTIVGTWFAEGPKKNLKITLALGAIHFWLRCASFASYFVLPQIAESSNLRTALYCSFLVCALSFVSAVMFSVGDWLDMKRKQFLSKDHVELIHPPAEKPTASSPKESLKEKAKRTVTYIIETSKHLPLLYWLVLLMTTGIVGSVYTFTSFGTIILNESRGFSESRAARTTSAVSLSNAISNPIMSIIIGYTGKRSWWMLLGTFMFSFVYLVFGFTTLEPLALMIILGIGQSVMDSVMFPVLSMVVKGQYLGVAAGITVTCENVALLIMPIVVGVLRDSGHATAANMVFGACALTSLTMACLIKVALWKLKHSTIEE